MFWWGFLAGAWIGVALVVVILGLAMLVDKYRWTKANLKRSNEEFRLRELERKRRENSRPLRAAPASFFDRK